MLNTLLAHKSNYGAARTKDKIKYIVLHYTGNATDTAEANAKYFQTANRKASAHYFVDSNSVYNSVKDLCIAWSVGGKKYSDSANTGGGKLYGKCNNSNSISVEICSKNGVFQEKALENAAELVKELMKRYNIPLTNVIRHFDVTGKHCPVRWCCSRKNDLEFEKFKLRLIDIPDCINATSKKEVINWMKDKLNKVDICGAVDKLSLNGQYNAKTAKYIRAVCKKYNWNPSKNGTEIHSKLINKLKTL